MKAGVPVIHFGTGTQSLLEEHARRRRARDRTRRADAARRRMGARGVRPRGAKGNLDLTVLFAPRELAFKHAGPRAFSMRQPDGRVTFLTWATEFLPETPVETVQAVIDYVHTRSARLPR